MFSAWREKKTRTIRSEMRSLSVYFSTNYYLFKTSCLSSKFFVAIWYSHILTDFPGDVLKNIIMTLKQKLYSFSVVFFLIKAEKNIRYSLFPPRSAFSLKCLRTLVHALSEMFK